MELLSITIAAGETKHFQRAGRYVEIFDATAAVTLRFYDDAGAEADNAVNALSGIFLELPFRAFTLYSATAQTVVLLVTDSRGGSRRQPGNVRVIDQAAEKTLSGLQFINSIRGTGVAAQVSYVGLRAVTRRVAVKRLTVQVATQTVLFLAYGDAPLAATINDGPTVNKLGAGAASNSRAFYLTLASSAPTALEINNYLNVVRIYPTNAAGIYGMTEVPLTTPIVLEPGKAIYFNGVDVNREIVMVADFEEL